MVKTRVSVVIITAQCSTFQRDMRLFPRKRLGYGTTYMTLAGIEPEIMQLARASSPLRHNATVMQHALVFQRDTGQSVFIDDTRVNAVDKQPRVCQF